MWLYDRRIAFPALEAHGFHQHPFDLPAINALPPNDLLFTERNIGKLGIEMC